MEKSESSVPDFLKREYTPNAWDVFCDSHREICCGYAYYEEEKQIPPSLVKDFHGVKEFSFSSGDFFDGFDTIRIILLPDGSWWYAFLPSAHGSKRVSPHICPTARSVSGSFHCPEKQKQPVGKPRNGTKFDPCRRILYAHGQDPAYGKAQQDDG